MVVAVGATLSGCDRDFRQPKVKNLGPALSHKNVRRLDVAMHDPIGVGGIKGVGDFDGERKNQFCLQRSSRNAMLECSPSRNSITMNDCPLLPNLVDGADVGVVQSGRRTCFSAKAFSKPVGLELGLQEET